MGSFEEWRRESPNCDRTRPHEKRGVLFHHSVSPFDETVARMLDPLSEVSYHLLIRADGLRCRLVPDETIAWHAGASHWLGRSRCNDFLLGVAFAGDTYREPLTDLQLASAREWLLERWASLRWAVDCVADHRQVAPGRKDDLNPPEWERVAAMVREVAAQAGTRA